jgi:hypothetical protein
MGRALGVLAALAALAAAAVAVATSPPDPSGGMAPAVSVAPCPLHDHRPITSDRPGAGMQLVPSGATIVHVCDYSGFTEPPPLPQTGPAHRLIGEGGVLDVARARRIADELNAIPPRSGPIACPADFGNQLVAYFLYPSGVVDPVTIGLSGCQSITNGHVDRLGMGRPVVSELARLARPATIRGRVELCGGPAPGRCRVETGGVCTPSSGCSTTDRVAVVEAGGPRVVTVRLHRARFSVEVPAGGYKLELLADGRRVHGKVVQVRRAKARAGRTTSVVFLIAIP